MVTMVESEELSPAAMDLQSAYYNLTNASFRGTSTDDAHNSHHNDNSTTAALIISTTALLGLLVAALVFLVYKFKGRRHHGAYRDLDTNTSNSNELQANV